MKKYKQEPHTGGSPQVWWPTDTRLPDTFDFGLSAGLGCQMRQRLSAVCLAQPDRHVATGKQIGGCCVNWSRTTTSHPCRVRVTVFGGQVQALQHNPCSGPDGDHRLVVVPNTSKSNACSSKITCNKYCVCTSGLRSAATVMLDIPFIMRLGRQRFWYVQEHHDRHAVPMC